MFYEKSLVLNLLELELFGGLPTTSEVSEIIRVFLVLMEISINIYHIIFSFHKIILFLNFVFRFHFLPSFPVCFQ